MQIRIARDSDAEVIATAVEALVRELRSDPSWAIEGSGAAAREILDSPDLGGAFVAEDRGRIIGLITYSLQHAIHAGGTYCIIQELWVDVSARSSGIGEKLVASVADRAWELGLTRVEVCLPDENWPDFRRTARFYERNGFSPTGPRRRLTLPRP